MTLTLHDFKGSSNGVKGVCVWISNLDPWYKREKRWPSSRSKLLIPAVHSMGLIHETWADRIIV